MTSDAELVAHARSMRETLNNDLPAGVGNTIDALCDIIERRLSPEVRDGELLERERSLQVIGDVVEHWLDWVARERKDEGLETAADTHIMLSYENAPPHWPTVGQLKRWIEVIRAPSISRDTEVTEAQLRAAYEEGVDDGIGWHCYPESGPQPQWIDSVARLELLQSLAMSAEAPRPMMAERDE